MEIVAPQRATTQDDPHGEVDGDESSPSAYAMTCMKRTGTTSASHTFSFPS
jgi:hypothetical protein